MDCGPMQAGRQRNDGWMDRYLISQRTVYYYHRERQTERVAHNNTADREGASIAARATLVFLFFLPTFRVDLQAVSCRAVVMLASAWQQVLKEYNYTMMQEYIIIFSKSMKAKQSKAANASTSLHIKNKTAPM
ncbi:hypothetical protein ACJX0J_005338 [Zea mays]